jgi:hypothetical protein
LYFYEKTQLKKNRFSAPAIKNRAIEKSSSVFGVVVVNFQSTFYSEKYANNIFLFFKNYF